MSNGQQSPSGSDNWKEAGLIFLAGAFGGFLSWVYAVTVGVRPVIEGILGVGASIALGTGASVIGVYLIANSDTRQMFRCLAFAILCGFSWKPVYDAGGALVNQSSERRAQNQLSSLSKDSSAANEQLRKATDTLLPAATQHAAKTTVELLNASAKVTDVSAKAKASAIATGTLKALADVAPRSPDDSAQAVSEIGKAAIENKQEGIARAATITLGSSWKSAKSILYVPTAYKRIGEISQLAEAKGDFDFAMDAKVIRASAVLDAAKVTLDDKFGERAKLIKLFPFAGAKTDLADAKKFWEAVGQTAKANEADTALAELDWVTKEVQK